MPVVRTLAVAAQAVNASGVTPFMRVAWKIPAHRPDTCTITE
jgi:hypothetical protein